MTTLNYRVWCAIRDNPGCSRQVVADAVGMDYRHVLDVIQGLRRRGAYVRSEKPRRPTRAVKVVYYAQGNYPPEGQPISPRSLANLRPRKPESYTRRKVVVLPTTCELERCWPAVRSQVDESANSCDSNLAGDSARPEFDEAA